jgi:hypothetical protein
VIEDPHISVFDGGQISLVDVAVKKVGERIGGGDKWLVKSGSVRIQARYTADERLEEGKEFVQAVAVGGPFLKGNVITVGSLEEPITWNGMPILEDGPSRFDVHDGNFSVEVTHSDHSLNVATGSKSRGIEMKLPMDVALVVNRLHHHLNVAITMPQQDGGQDGLCGNFNSMPTDDTLEFTSNRMDVNVPNAESLFTGLAFA